MFCHNVCVDSPKLMRNSLGTKMLNQRMHLTLNMWRIKYGTLLQSAAWWKKKEMRPKKPLASFPINNVVSFLFSYTADLIQCLKNRKSLFFIKYIIINVILYYSGYSRLLLQLLNICENVLNSRSFTAISMIEYLF